MRTHLLLQILLLAAVITAHNHLFAQSDWFWQNPLPTGSSLVRVSFIDANRGTAVGEAGTILSTTNGGLNWISQSSGTTQWLYGVFFTDANTGTAVGWAGTILRTTDGGTSWIRQSSVTTVSLLSVSFTDANTGTAVGEWGTIIRTLPVTGIREDFFSTNPSGFSLMQNFPNPFYPSTTIRFSVPRSGFVSLTVYDQLWREVAVLVSGERAAGTYTVVWDAAALTGGLYFYRLQSSEFSKTKKMILLR